MNARLPDIDVEEFMIPTRDAGIDALAGKPRRGGVPKIRGEHAQRLNPINTDPLRPQGCKPSQMCSVCANAV